MTANIGAIQEHVEREEERIRREREERWRERQKEERELRMAMFRSGADCPWTPLDGSNELYRRINGRAYRATPTPDKLWLLHRIKNVDDAEPIRLGKYKRRTDITQALATLAYADEPRWN